LAGARSERARGPVIVVPNGVDTSALTPTPLPPEPNVLLPATLNYRPNPIARSMRTRKTRLIGPPLGNGGEDTAVLGFYGFKEGRLAFFIRKARAECAAGREEVDDRVPDVSVVELPDRLPARSRRV
jgi:hypothetical protein